MEFIAHQETRDGVRLKIIGDNDAESPREWDNLCVMVCDHGRYNLGDYETSHGDAADAIRASRDYRPTWEDYDGEGLDFSNGPDLYKAIQRCTDIVTLPLYLYDHSGITMSTGKFSCPWDSGQVGFAFVTKAKILENWGGKVLTAKLREKAESGITAEVETYDMYLTGDVYGYVVEKLEDEEDEDGEEVESCWGCFGLSYAIDEGRAAAGWKD